MYINIETKSMSKKRFIKPDKLITSQQTKYKGYPPEPFNQYMYNLKLLSYGGSNQLQNQKQARALMEALWQEYNGLYNGQPSNNCGQNEGRGVFYQIRDANRQTSSYFQTLNIFCVN